MQVGQVIREKYRLLRLLGDGGMGSVYEAQHEMLGTRVAIKVLHPELTRRPGLVERFMQEARVAAQIKSPYVVQVTDVDKTPDNIAFIVMELLEGEPMSSLLERERKVPIPLACEYTIQILRALEAAHALGVVHRDLKPENVFITFAAGKPVLKLIDFGIAKLKSTDPGAKNLTVAGVMMGTAEYMAPEQAYSADKVDARSDIYAVGVMLYELISGARPVVGEDARIIAVKVERGEVQPLVHAAPDVPREVAGLVHRAMAARPELRFSSAAEMRIALEGAMSGKRSPTIQLPEKTGTVMGAPVDAVLGAGIRLDPRLAAMPAGTGTLPAPLDSPHGTSSGAPQNAQWAGQPQMAQSQLQSQPQYDRHPSPPRRQKSSAPLIAGIFLVLIAGGAAAGYFVYWQSPDDPAPPLSLTPPAATKTVSPIAVVPTTPQVTADPLTPLGTTTVRPPTPPTPPRPAPSGGPAPKPSGSTAPPVPTTPTFPPIFPSSFPNPFPPGSNGAPPVFTIPTTFPSVFPPMFPMQPAPTPAPPATSASPSPGY